MYAALWRALPGPWWVRVVILAVVAALVVTGLVLWVFPLVAELVAPQEVTVNG